MPDRFRTAPEPGSIHLHLIRQGGVLEAERYALLSLSIVPTHHSPSVTTVVPYEVTATLDIDGESLQTATGALHGSGRLTFRWELEAATAGVVASALEQDGAPFSVVVSQRYHVVDVDAEIAGVVEPDVLSMTTEGLVELRQPDGELLASVERSEALDLPPWTWQTHIASVLNPNMAGVKSLGVRVFAEPNPPQRPQRSESIGWLSNGSASATLRLAPLEERRAHAQLIGLFETSEGRNTLAGKIREHSGRLLMIGPDDVPGDLINLRAEAALLSQARLEVAAISEDGRFVVSTPLDRDGATLVVEDRATVELQVIATSLVDDRTAQSLEMPAQDSVVDRAWFPSFGTRSATIRAPGLNPAERVDLEVRLHDEDADAAKRLSLTGGRPIAKWSFFNHSPFEPQLTFRVPSSPSGEWLAPVPADQPLTLERTADEWRLSPGPPHTDPHSEEPTVKKQASAVINGIDCRWDPENPTSVTYRAPSVEPARNAKGHPLASIIAAADQTIVQVAAEWKLTPEQLMATRAELAQRQAVDPVVVRMRPVMGALDVELLAVNERGHTSVMVAGSSSGSGDQNCALSAELEDADHVLATVEAFRGETNRLLVRYFGGGVDLLGDVGAWIAASDGEHVITIPGRTTEV